MANKVKGPKLYLSQFGGEQPIPPEFVAAMERKEEVQAVPNDVVPEALSDLIVESKLETNRTGERVRKTVKKKSGNIVLGATRTNDQGQPVQVVLTLFPTGTAPAAPTATTNVSVKDLGNGWSIQEVGVEGSYDGGGVFVPGVFNNNLFGKETPNVTPQKFKTLIPVVTTRTDSAGTASAPTLTGGEFREVQEQITAYKKRVTVETQTDPTLPVALTEYETTNAKQLATVTETLETVGVPSAPTALTTVQVNNLGDGRQVRRLSTVGSLFPETRVSDEGEAAYLDSRIQHFFVAYDKKVTSTVAAGTSATPSALADPITVAGLATGIGTVSSQAERIDATKVRVSDTVVTASSLSTLRGVEFDKINGDVLPITREVVEAGTAGTVLQIDGTYATVEPINSRFSIKTTRKTTTLSSSGRSYITWEDVTLPRVLTQFNAVVFTDKAVRDAYQNTVPETVTTYSGDIITFPEFQNPYHQKPGC